MPPKPPPPEVQAAFAQAPDHLQARLAEMREIIFDVANAQNAGPLTETLKWGEPAYLTEATKSGSTLRLGWKGTDCVLYLNCRTNLVDRARDRFPTSFTFKGNRAIHVPAKAPFDREAFAIIASMALTYHRNKSR